MQPQISAKNLTLQVDNRTILADFTADIFPGEFIGVFGSNGAGKSTFLHAILGLRKPTAGQLHVFGKSPECGNPHIGYLPQSRFTAAKGQFTGLSLLQSAVRAHRYGLPILSQQERHQIQEVLALVEGEHLCDRPLVQLSGGERQRLLLAQTLLGQPKILLLDEPLNNLDPHYQEIIVHLVQKVAKQLNVTVLFTAHDVNPLLKVMDRVLYFAKGKGAIGAVDEVITSEQLTLLYGSPMEVVHLQQRVFVISKMTGAAEFCSHCE